MLIEVSSINDEILLKEFEAAPNNFASLNILNGLNKGKLYLTSDAQGAVIFENTNRPYIFLAGKLSAADLSDILEIFPDHGVLYCNLKYHEWFIKNGFKIFFRIKFRHANYIETPLNNDLTIKPIDNLEILQRCSKYNTIIRRFGNIENFLKVGMGYVLCNRYDEIISQVCSAYVLPDAHEVDIFTHEKYRAAGAASQICSHFIKECLKQKKIPVWMCNSDNLASIKTALKLGFEIEQYYPQIIK